MIHNAVSCCIILMILLHPDARTQIGDPVADYVTSLDSIDRDEGHGILFNSKVDFNNDGVGVWAGSE